jgi:hypothetical protein
MCVYTASVICFCFSSFSSIIRSGDERTHATVVAQQIKYLPQTVWRFFFYEMHMRATAAKLIDDQSKPRAVLSVGRRARMRQLHGCRKCDCMPSGAVDRRSLPTAPDARVCACVRGTIDVGDGSLHCRCIETAEATNRADRSLTGAASAPCSCGPLGSFVGPPARPSPTGSGLCATSEPAVAADEHCCYPSHPGPRTPALTKGGGGDAFETRAQRRPRLEQRRSTNRPTGRGRG